MTQSIMDSLFQKTLSDLIKSLRLNLITTSTILNKSLSEIRTEIKSTDPLTKSTALEKLIYLNSIHSVPISWASFHIVEVMSSAKFCQKKIGYLAASQCFNENTDVILLITNQLRKDLTSGNEYEVSLALECLSVVSNTDLARDLSNEIFVLLSSGKVGVKKKAVAVVLRVFRKYPDAVRVSFKRLVENLESKDNVVVSAVVGVFCELCRDDPRSYLPLAPEFYRVLVDCRNNWVLIKVLKVFSKLCPLEPRLGRRIVEPVCELMRRTSAKSLMFECVRTVVECLSEYEEVVKIAVEKVKELLAEDDPNLKYLGLHALSILARTHLWAVEANKEMIVKSLSDDDPNIKLEGLRLMMEMVSESNVAEICKVLLSYALKADPKFCNEILGNILSTCSRNVYGVVVDFEWYVSLLGEMSRNPLCQKGEEIERQFVDIGLRVKEVRLELVSVSRDLIIDPALLGNSSLHRILCAAAWVCGEYVEFSRNPFEVIEALLQPRSSLLPPLLRAVYIQSAFKVLVFCLYSYFKQSADSNLSEGKISLKGRQAEEFDSRYPINAEKNIVVEGDMDKIGAQIELSFDKDSYITHESIVHMLNLVKMALGPLLGIDEVQVQERARNVLGLVDLILEELSGLAAKDRHFMLAELQSSKLIEIMHDAFSEDFGPVSVTAQERVPLPDGLTLEDNLFALEEICGDLLQPTSSSISYRTNLFAENEGVSSTLSIKKKGELEPSTDSSSLLTEHRKRHGLFYLPSEKNGDGSSDYPPANDPHSAVPVADSAQDLLKLTEKSFTSKRKQNQAKTRPQVVKLDEGDELPVSVAKPANELRDYSLSGAIRDYSLSGAIRDILLGEPQSTLSQPSQSTVSPPSPSDKSSSRRRKTKEVAHHNQGKGSRKSTRSRHRAVQSPNVVAQTSEIPDFLL